jgi:hypothetical protein
MQKTAGLLFANVVVSKKSSIIEMQLLLETTAVAAGIDDVVAGNGCCVAVKRWY